MQIAEAIERCYLVRDNLTDPITSHLIDMYSHKKWIDMTGVFLRAIGNQHQVPGSVVYKLSDICSEYHEYQTVTRKQIWYVARTMIDHWDQMCLEVRCQLV
jgi:hypothetical protein